MSDESRSGEFELPPELSDLENSLRELPLPSQSSQSGDAGLDRDELMFQSGWAAALAQNANPNPTVAARPTGSALRWGWPALAGTFATLSAVLAIALFSVPSDNGNLMVATKPAIEIPELVVESQPPKSHNGDFYRLANQRSDRLDDPDDALSDQTPLERTVSPFVESLLRFKPAPSSALAMRRRLLRTIELNEFVRPVTYRTSTRPQAAPLRANSYRNQPIWEQL